MLYYTKCNKIFQGNKVMVYDYKVQEAYDNGNDLIFQYEDGNKTQFMTIKHGDILKKGKLDPKIWVSKFNGPHKEYKCYYFKWEPDGEGNNQVEPTRPQLF